MNGQTDDTAHPVYLFDTSVIIQHLNDGNSVLGKGKRFISVITEMEVLAKPHILLEMEQKALRFLKGFTIVPLSNAVKYEAIRIRREGLPRLKLPDSIIAATAVVLDAQLITADEKLRRLAWPGFNATLPSFKYSASTYKKSTDGEGFFKTSFGRIFCFAKNRAFRGFRRLRGRSAPLQSLAHEPASKSAMRIYDRSQ
jgi:predicted nucleic acid-binding protein